MSSFVETASEEMIYFMADLVSRALSRLPAGAF